MNLIKTFIILSVLIINFSLVYAVYTDTITIDAGDLYVEAENKESFKFNEESNSFSIQGNIEFKIGEDSLTISDSNPVEVEFESTLEINPISEEEVNYQTVKLTTEDSEVTISSPKEHKIDMSYVGNGLNIVVGEDKEPILFTNLPVTSSFEIGETGKIKSVEIEELEEEIVFGLAEMIVEEKSTLKTENIEITFNNKGKVKVKVEDTKTEKITFTGEANIGALNVNAGENPVTVSVPKVKEGEQETIHITSKVTDENGKESYGSFNIAYNTLEGDFNIGNKYLEILNQDGIFMSGDGILVRGAGNVYFDGKERDKEEYVSIGDRIIIVGNQELRLLPGNELVNIEPNDFLVLEAKGGRIELKEENAILNIKVKGEGNVVNGDTTFVNNGENVFVGIGKDKFNIKQSVIVGAPKSDLARVGVKDTISSNIQFEDKNGNSILLDKNGKPANFYVGDGEEGGLVLTDNVEFSPDGIITCPSTFITGAITKALSLITGRVNILQQFTKVHTVYEDCIIHKIKVKGKEYLYLSTIGLEAAREKGVRETEPGEYVKQNIKIVYNKVLENEVNKLTKEKGLTKEEALSQIDKELILSKTLNLIDCSEIEVSDCNGYINQLPKNGELVTLLKYVDEHKELPKALTLLHPTKRKLNQKSINYKEEIGILGYGHENVEIAEVRNENIIKPKEVEIDTSKTLKMTVNTKNLPLNLILLEEEGSPKELKAINLIKQAQQEGGSIYVFEDEIDIISQVAAKIGWSVGDSTKHTVQFEKL